MEDQRDLKLLIAFICFITPTIPSEQMIPARVVQEHLRGGQAELQPIHDRLSDIHLPSQSSLASTVISDPNHETTFIDCLSHDVNVLHLDQPEQSYKSRPSYTSQDDSGSPTTTDLYQPPYRSSSPSNKGKGRALDVIPESVGTDGMELYYRSYRSEEEDLEDIMRLVEQELSEPYNINGAIDQIRKLIIITVYTFRYFLIDWPHLAFLVYPSATSRTPIGVIVCKQDSHRNRTNRGYIAMLSVDKAYRRRGIASRLIRLAIDEMTRRGAHEIVLETEHDNSTSLALYESLGFMREKRLHRFYSNGKDAFRLIYALPHHPYLQEESDDEAEHGRWEVGSGPEWLESLTEEEAMMRGLGGPIGWGDLSERGGRAQLEGEKRPGTPGLGRPDLPPRPKDWDGMYT